MVLGINQSNSPLSEIYSLLKILNFTKTEAAVYVDLLRHSSSNGYQIAKNLSMSRSSVYSALDSLYKSGIVFLMPGESQVYIAENPSVLINKMKNKFVDAADSLEEKLSALGKDNIEERFLNIEGYDNVVSKAKELLLSAEKEIYMSTDFDLHIFYNELSKLTERGVRIIVFSFSKLDAGKLPIEIYSFENADCIGKQTRIMLVADCKKTLVADAGPHRKEFLGTFTENTLLASVISEHIHNDIYLLKLRKRTGKDIIDNDIKLGTMLEKRGDKSV